MTRMYEYTFPAQVWTVAPNKETAIEQLGELTSVAQHTSVGISIDHKYVNRERNTDWEDAA